MSADLLTLHRRALESAESIVLRIRTGELDGPTPCGDWTLDELLRHMTGQHYGFASAARRLPPAPEVWEPAESFPDPVAAYCDASQEALLHMSELNLSTDSVELWRYGVLPAAVVFGMHVVDYLAHGWDVAKSIGIETDLDDPLYERGLEIAVRWPQTAFETGDPFGPHVLVATTASARDRLMAYLGRDPDWRPARAIATCAAEQA